MTYSSMSSQHLLLPSTICLSKEWNVQKKKKRYDPASEMHSIILYLLDLEGIIFFSLTYLKSSSEKLHDQCHQSYSYFQNLRYSVQRRGFVPCMLLSDIVWCLYRVLKISSKMLDCYFSSSLFCDLLDQIILARASKLLSLIANNEILFPPMNEIWFYTYLNLRDTWHLFILQRAQYNGKQLPGSELPT